METVHVRTRSDANGILHLDIPVNKPDFEFDITLTLESSGFIIPDTDNFELTVNEEESYEDLDELLCD